MHLLRKHCEGVALLHCQAAASHLHYMSHFCQHRIAAADAAAAAAEDDEDAAIAYAVPLLLLLRLLLRTVHLP
jgi:hypothetical protein